MVTWHQNAFTYDLESLEKILHYIDATVVLHNMIIEFGNAHDGDAEWVDKEQLIDIGDVTCVTERDCSDLPLPMGSLPGTRCKQLKKYINETWFQRGGGCNGSSLDDMPF